MPGRCAPALAALALGGGEEGGAPAVPLPLRLLALRALGVVATESAWAATEHAAPAALRLLVQLHPPSPPPQMLLQAEAAGLLSALALRWPELRGAGEGDEALDDALVSAAAASAAPASSSPFLLAAVARLLARGRVRLSAGVLRALLLGGSGGGGGDGEGGATGRRAMRAALACGAASRAQLVLGLLAAAGAEQLAPAPAEEDGGASATAVGRKRGRRHASDAPATNRHPHLPLLLDLLRPQDLADDALVLPLLQLALAPTTTGGGHDADGDGASAALALALLSRARPSARARAAACALICALPEPLPLSARAVAVLQQQLGAAAAAAAGGRAAAAAAEAAAARLRRAASA